MKNHVTLKLQFDSSLILGALSGHMTATRAVMRRNV